MKQDPEVAEVCYTFSVPAAQFRNYVKLSYEENFSGFVFLPQNITSFPNPIQRKNLNFSPNGDQR
jgi:hypothetical protein